MVCIIVIIILLVKKLVVGNRGNILCSRAHINNYHMIHCICSNVINIIIIIGVIGIIANLYYHTRKTNSMEPKKVLISYLLLKEEDA